MLSLSFFADERDAPLLVERLNSDPGIAFIVPDGPADPQAAYAAWLREAVGGSGPATIHLHLSYTGAAGTGERLRAVPQPARRWKSVSQVGHLRQGGHCLWHIPGGPLSLPGDDGQHLIIPDPWAGWEEQRPGADPTTPYFGPVHPAVIRLESWSRHRPYSAEERTALPVLISYWAEGRDLLVVSDLSWSGDACGDTPEASANWQREMGAWFARTATQVGSFRYEDPDTGDEEEYSFWAFPSALEKLRSGMDYYARGADLTLG